MSILSTIVSFFTRKNPISGIPYIVSSPMLARIVNEYQAAFKNRWPRAQEIEKLPFVKEVKASPPQEQLRTVQALLSHYRQRPVALDYRYDSIIRSVMPSLLAKHLPLTKDDATLFANFLIAEKERIYLYPYLQMITAIARYGEEQHDLPFVVATLSQLKKEIKRGDVLEKITRVEAKFAGSKGDMTVAADELGAYLTEYAKKKPFTAVVTQAVVLAATAQGAAPTAKFITAATALEKEYGDKLHTVIHDVLSHFTTLNLTQSEQHTYNTHQYMVVQVTLKELSIATVKGLCWTAGICTKYDAVQDLTAVALHAYKKVPTHGPAITTIGNACIVSCAFQGRNGVKGLSVIQHKIKTNKQAVKLVNKQLLQLSQKVGISVSQLQEGAVEEYSFNHGVREIIFGDAGRVKMMVHSPADVTIQWFNGQQKEVSQPPESIKGSFEKELKAEKKVQKEILDLLSVHAGRFDSFYLENRSWTFGEWKEQYAKHGVFWIFVSRLIWQVKQADGKWQSVWWEEDHFTVRNGGLVEVPDDSEIKLWHPIVASVDEVMEWRNFIMTKKVVQPIKQAFREVYIVTDAELSTKSYSNRMAAHIIRQHQFSALAKQRNWNYTLRGWWDNSDSPIARKDLAAFKMTAEFWLEDIDSYETNATSSGVMTYVTTDQVRFYQGGTQLNMDQVHPLVFSEVMRDVDLFVGVASIGNDPQWQDQGAGQRFNTYWQSFSFGNLSESAKVRKSLLETIIPSLSIADICTIEGNYVVVKGTYNTYKIHIGSSNIMMEPGNRYLCIVPARGDTDKKSTVFLPFEGDRTLSLIISKALLLAQDTKITDTTITRQIRR